MATKTNDANAAYAEALRRIEACGKERQSRLDLRQLGITTLPPEIGNLADLTTLDLKDNLLTTLPPEFAQLKTLLELDLTRNPLTILPLEVTQLAALTTLYVHSIRLAVLPPAIAQLKALTVLDFGANEVTTLPPEIGELTKLKSLTIADNQLTTLPPEIGQLAALTGLNLARCQLTTLPPEIGQLAALTALDLSANELTRLPAEIGQLTALTGLDLSGNELTTLPPEIGHLTALTTLYLFSNLLTTLPPDIGRLKALSYIGLQGNELTTLPPAIGQLTALTTLILSDNQFSTLPPELEHLKALISLYLEENQLTALPIWLGQLPHLENLSISGNPLPAELLQLGRSGSAHLIRYLRKLTPIATQTGALVPKRFDEAKLVFVGPGEVGKTWLLAALQGRTPQHTPATKGLEIARQPLPLSHPTESGRILQLNCWDFGGQEHYQITHQIFFSPKAIYLLVWKPRTGLDPDLMNRLERIQLSAGRTAKVLIVSTHADGNVLAVIGKDAIKDRFGDLIEGFYETDSAKGPAGTGIAALRDAIAKAAAQLEGMDTPFPPSWHIAQAAIRRSKKTTMTFAEFAKACKNKGSLDRDSAADLAAVMEVQGHAVFFADAVGASASGLADDKNLVVLDPEWLAKAVGFVLEDRHTMERSGILEHGRLAAIWKREAKRGCPGYRRDLHGYLLWLMWKFDIAYRQSEHTSLLPELIQRNRPDDLRWTPTQPAAAEREANLICRIPQHPPLGLIPALTAAVHPLRRVQNPEPQTDQLDRNWRDGFFLDTAVRGTAFVELQDRDLLIVVRDKYPSDLSKRITKTLDEIVKVRWPRLEIDFRVPCIGKVKEKACPGSFRKSVLETRPSVFCEDCRKDLEAAKMLEGFDAHEEEVMRQLTELNLGQRELLDGQRDLLAASYRFFRQSLDPDRIELARAPCMLTIVPEGAETWQLLSKLTEDRLRVTCWCEHPDGPHPAAPLGSDDPPNYLLITPKGWLARATPYISWAATLFKAFVPLVGTGLTQLAGATAPQELKDQVALMNDIARAIPTGKLEIGNRFELDKFYERGLLLRPEIVALRHIHDALLEHVPKANQWGDLRPVSTKSGELLWLCAEHAAIQQPPVQKL